MYFDDHTPPHFHAQAAGRIARVRIDNCEALTNDLTRKQLALVRSWAAIHQMSWKRTGDGLVTVKH
jgi:hypothetical protein